MDTIEHAWVDALAWPTQLRHTPLPNARINSRCSVVIASSLARRTFDFSWRSWLRRSLRCSTCFAFLFANRCCLRSLRLRRAATVAAVTSCRRRATAVETMATAATKIEASSGVVARRPCDGVDAMVCDLPGSWHPRSPGGAQLWALNSATWALATCAWTRALRSIAVGEADTAPCRPWNQRYSTPTDAHSLWAHGVVPSSRHP